MSLTTLTALNARLIAQEVGTVVEEVDEGTGLVVGPEGAQPEDPDEDEDEDSPEVRGRFSTEDPREFQRIKDWIEINIFGGDNPVSSSLTNLFINEWDVEWRKRQGLEADEEIGRGVTLEALMADEGFVNGLMWLPLTATNQLPPFFETDVVDEEGETVPMVAVSNPLTGVEFTTVEEVVEDPVLSSTIVRRAPGSKLAEQMGKASLAKIRAQAEKKGGKIVGLGPVIGNALRDPNLGEDRVEVPHITTDQLNQMLSQATTTTTGGRGRGGGGGGGTRRELVFDKDQLIAQVEDRWNRWMLEGTPAPTGTVTSWVDSYIREARAFWSGKGGQLDFDTYITNKFEAHPRFQLIYKDKLPAESPEQYLQKWMQPIAGLGMSNEFTRGETEASILSGGSQEGQLDRVRQMREVMVSRQGDFSQRFAQTLAGIGIG